MTISYPDGRHLSANQSKKLNTSKYNRSVNYGRRGMNLEDDLNETNLFYLANNRAVIHKKPTPVQVVRVDYPKRSSAMIKEAYFKQPSTTDYNGVYKGKYLDFEAKETKNTTSFPLNNFHPHQMEHMARVVKQNGIAFLIVSFNALKKVYLTMYTDFEPYWERMIAGGRKSITHEELKKISHQIAYGLNPRLDFLQIIDKYIH